MIEPAPGRPADERGDATLPVLSGFAVQLRSALELLEQGRRLALDVSCDPVEFGIGLDQFHRFDVPDMLITWFLRKGYVKACTPGEGNKQTGGHEATVVEVENQSTVYLLTESGIRLAHSVLSADSSSLLGAPTSLGIAGRTMELELQHGGVEVVKPEWDIVRRELWYSGKLIKRYKLPSMNQETILTAFQEERWTLRIDDPLPQHAKLNPHVRLGNTIKALNRHQKNPLLRFRGDGTGEGVIWEPTGDRTDPGPRFRTGLRTLRHTIRDDSMLHARNWTEGCESCCPVPFDRTREND